MKSRKSILIFFYLIYSISIFSAIDLPKPRFIVTVNDQNKIKVDSFFIIDNVTPNQFNLNDFGSKDLSVEQKITILNNKFKLKVKLTDSTLIYSEPILIKDKYTQYEFVIKNNKVEIYKNRGDYYLYIAKIILLLIIASFLFKVLIFLFKFEIKNKLTYSLKYTVLNLIFCLLYLFLFRELFTISLLIAPIVSLIIICITEIWLHKHDKNVINKNVNPTILIVNSLFYTIGVFVFIIIGLLFDLTHRL
jgi:hypothetical protein